MSMPTTAQVGRALRQLREGEQELGKRHDSYGDVIVAFPQ
jgi:hypothetical protein